MKSLLGRTSVLFTRWCVYPSVFVPHSSDGPKAENVEAATELSGSSNKHPLTPCLASPSSCSVVFRLRLEIFYTYAARASHGCWGLWRNSSFSTDAGTQSGVIGNVIIIGRATNIPVLRKVCSVIYYAPGGSQRHVVVFCSFSLVLVAGSSLC